MGKTSSGGPRGLAQPFLRNLIPEGALPFSRSVRKGGAFNSSPGGGPSDAYLAARADAPSSELRRLASIRARCRNPERSRGIYEIPPDPPEAYRVEIVKSTTI